MRLLLVLVLPILLLVACTGRGVVLSSDGIRDNTAENARAHVIALITSDLDARLGPSARADVAIAGQPRWRTAGRRHSEGWYWDQAGVQVDLVGDAGARPTLEPAEVEAIVERRLRPAVLDDDLQVRVSVSEDRERFVRLGGMPAVPATAPRGASEPAPATAPGPAVRTTTARHYTVQPGDTWADLSTAFYGTPQHWRLIAAANPEVDGALNPGQSIVIPPRP